MPNIGTSPDMHSLEKLLYFAPNSPQVVYVEPQSLTHLSPLASPHRPSLPPPPLLPPPPPLLPPLPPPLLSSCLAPLAHRYRRHCCFCCSLLIVVCPRLCHCRCLCRLCHHRRLCFQHLHCRPPSNGCCHDCLRHNSCHCCRRDCCRRTSCRRQQQCNARPTS